MRPSLVLPGALLLGLLSLPAHAYSARLLSANDAVGASATAATSTLLPGDPMAAPVAHGPSYASVLGVGALTGFIAAPVGLYFASFVGSLGINIIAAALPAALIMGLFAPAVTTFAAWAYGNWRQDGRFGFLPAFGAAALVNIVALLVSASLGLSVGAPMSVLLFGLVDGVLMGGTAVGTMWVLSNKEPAVALRSFVPGTSDTTFVPLSTVSF